MTTAEPVAELAPWMVPLSPEAREAVRQNVSQAPPLTDRQRERLRLLFAVELLPTPEKN